ncbi:hypothetical protein OQA88_6337 [Cercophora sp. LCS_1]
MSHCQPLATAPNPNASAAASAAAAALRARPMTPTRVADVQTERTLRRSTSAASSAASSEPQGRPTLNRRGSSGSMTERTFRSPSPHRQTQSLSYTASEEAPPVPALPKEVAPKTQQQAQPRRRATSLGVTDTPVRLASQILASDNAPSWFSAAKLGDPRNIHRTDPAMASPPSSPPRAVQETHQGETGRSSSRASSINFSYPTRLKVGSPPASPVDTRKPAELPRQPEAQPQPSNSRGGQQPRQSKPKQRKRASTSEPLHAGSEPAPQPSDQVLVYDPNSRRMVRQADLRAAEQSFSEASEPPVGQRRKKQSTQRIGSHPAKATVGRIQANKTQVGQNQGAYIADSHSGTQSPPEPQSSRPQGATDFEEPPVEAIISSPRIEAQLLEHRGHSDNKEPVRVKSPVLAHPTASWETKAIKRLPSIVREEPEPESEPEKQASRSISEALDAVPARSRVRVGNLPEALQNDQEPQAIPALGLATSPSSVPVDGDSGDAPEALQPGPSIGQRVPKLEAPEPIKTVTYGRTNSVSPVRQAHFGPVSSKLTVRHSPPPRSISPRKSALKHSGSPSRGDSPSDDTSEASGGMLPREEPSVSRKKSVRVSFDDGNTVVVGAPALPGHTETSPAASPQNSATRRPWYSIERTKELSPLDDDEVMKPRPALPSFGSVRDRKPRDVNLDEGERPLVRPIGERSSVAQTPKYAFTSGDSFGHSHDHAVGAVLASESDDRSRIAANTSRFREPLPPVVTSVEGAGYLSDSSTSSESEAAGMPEVAEATVDIDQPLSTESEVGTPKAPQDGGAKAEEAGSSTPAQNLAQPQGEEQSQKMAVPIISVSQPTPLIVDQKGPGVSLLDIPGGFPQDDSDVSADASEKATTPIPATAPEPTPQATETLRVGHGTPAEPETDSESSIYSDAYEDLSEIEGGGFQSLDAVLEEPSVTSVPQALITQEVAPPQPLPQEDPVEAKITLPTATSNVVAQTPTPEEEWEKAKVFWRSLSSAKRAQLEKEALEEAGVDADLEETKPEPKPKKKKSVERRTSERKALAVHLAQQMVSQQEQETQTKPVDRSYMIKPGTRWSEGDTADPSMRTSLRGKVRERPASSSDAPRLRKSLRTNGSASGTESKEVTYQRPMSLPGSSKAVPRRETLETGPQVQGAVRKHQGQPAPIKRRGSTSSESSFKRSRPAAGGHFAGFRTSMRQPSPSTSQAERPSSKRFSLRSLSPAASAFKKPAEAPPVSLATGAHLRQTLRGSSNERKKSPLTMRVPSFSLSPGSKKAGKRASGSRLSSRFADSSDEDTENRSGFRSRFEDSSDDEAALPIPMPKTLPTGLGQLRNQESLASTALPEELEESEGSPVNKESPVKPQPVQTAADPFSEAPVTQPPQPARALSGRLTTSHSALVMGTTKSAERRNSKRGSIMSALRRKRHDSTGKIARPDLTESAARMDTKLERNSIQLRGIRKSGEGEAEESVEDEKEGHTQKEAPRSPKLQKRVASVRRSVSAGHASDVADIPLPLALTSPMAADSMVQGTVVGQQSMAVGGAEDKDFIHTPLRRPSATSGNLGTRTLSTVAGTQPSLLGRRTMSAGVLSVDAPSATGTAQKKKKFGALRRMFGLDD